MAYEIYQSHHKGAEIDALLDDVKDIKPKVESMEQSYPVDKVVMADGSTLPTFIAKDLASKQDLADAIKDFETSTDIQQDIANATKDFKTETEIQQMISQSAYTLPEATDTTLGGVKVDGTTIIVDPDGTIHGASNIKKISDIGDVEFTDLEDGDVMKYDAANEKWVNVKGGGSGDVPDNTVLYDEEIIKDQFIGNASDYTISGNYPQNVEIHDDYIRLFAATYSMFQRTLANYTKPFNNKGKLEFKIRNDGNGAYTYIGYYIGTGIGKNDLYESPNLVLDNTVKTFEIDLTQFTNDELYLTLAVEIYSGNGVDAKVLSIVHEYKTGETTLVNLHGDVLNPKIDMGDLALLSDEKEPIDFKAPVITKISTSDALQDTPVGHIISYMGNSAPEHYLICDGTEYSIKVYQELANFFKKEFGKINFFGGDGTTTFAVPDLRGEFLRGTGENGSDVGVHQDGTEFPYMEYTSPYTGGSMGSNFIKTIDSEIISDRAGDKWAYWNITGTNNSNPNVGELYGHFVTSRPTNTSVLYCIKYEPTYFMQITDPGYSTEEVFTGKRWIDGKPIYRKVIETVSPNGPSSNVSVYDCKTLNIDRCINIYGMLEGCISVVFYDSPSYYITTYYDYGAICIRQSVAGYYNSKEEIIIEYTKTTD